MNKQEVMDYLAELMPDGDDFAVVADEPKRIFIAWGDD